MTYLHFSIIFILIVPTHRGICKNKTDQMNIMTASRSRVLTVERNSYIHYVIHVRAWLFHPEYKVSNRKIFIICKNKSILGSTVYFVNFTFKIITIRILLCNSFFIFQKVCSKFMKTLSTFCPTVPTLHTSEICCSILL